MGSRWGVLFFPRVLIQLIRLKGRTGHHLGGSRVVQIGLDALPQGMELFPRQAQLAREARRGLAFGHAAQQEHQGGRALPGFREGRPGQRGIVALAGPAAVGRKVALVTEQAPFGAATAWAYQPVRVEIALQPEDADAVVQEFGTRKVDPVVIIPQPAR